MKKNGFTLIELLVVIAILGILTSIVLAFLSSARNRAKDGKIKEELHQVRSEAEIYHTQYNSYTNLCNGPTLDNFANSILPMVTSGGHKECGISPNGGSYAIEISRNGDSFWCIDSTGFAGNTKLPPVGNRVCSQNSSEPLCVGNPGTYICDPL